MANIISTVLTRIINRTSKEKKKRLNFNKKISKYKDVAASSDNEIFLECQGYRGVYDGLHHTITVNAKNASSVKYSIDNRKTWTDDCPEICDVGKIRCFVKAVNGRKRKIKAVLLRVDKRNIVAKSESLTKEYDGHPLTSNEILLEGDGFVISEGVVFKTCGKQICVGESVNDIEYTLASNTNPQNYNISLMPGVLKIVNRKEKIPVTICGDDWEYVYDGSEKTVDSMKDLSITVNDVNYSVMVNEPFITKTEIGIYRYDGGENLRIIDGDSNDVTEQFNITFEAGLLIIKPENKIPLTIKGKSATYIYNDLVYEVNGLEKDEGEVFGRQYRITGVRGGISGFDVGEYINILSGEPCIYDYENNDITSWFDIEMIPGSLVIQKNPDYTFVLEANSREVFYDGEAKEVSGLKQTVFKINNRKYYVSGVEAFLSCTEIGNYVVRINGDPQITNELGDDITSNCVLKLVDGFLNIITPYKKLEIILETKSQEFEYCGKPISLEGFVQENYHYYGHDYHIENCHAECTATDVGEYEVRVSGQPHLVDENNVDRTYFFEVTVVLGKLKIVPSNTVDIDYTQTLVNSILQKITGETANNQDGCQFSRRDLAAMYKDTKILLDTELNPKYLYMLEQKEGSDSLTILKNRIISEFPKVKLLCSIEISEEEFDLLILNLKKAYVRLIKYDQWPRVDILITITMVQIGIRYYKNSYWPNVVDVLGITSISAKSRQKLGSTVTETLAAFGKPTYNMQEYVNNIMMHSFISDYYASKFFDYLFAYYSIDLGRTLSGVREMEIEEICDSIVNPFSKNQQLLSNYTAMSIRGDRDYCKKVIAATLVMIDQGFWDEDDGYSEVELAGRLRDHFERWKKNSSSFKWEKENNKKVLTSLAIKQYRTPHLVVDLQTCEFRVILPPQIIRFHEDIIPTVKWIVVTNKPKEFECYLSEAYSGGKTQEIGFSINPDEIFEKQVFLLFVDNELVRQFSWNSTEVVFFDSKGEYVKELSLQPGELYVFLKEGRELQSSALQYSGIRRGLNFYELYVHLGDFIIIPGLNNYYIGDIPELGISDKDEYDGLKVEFGGHFYPVYSKIPQFVIDLSNDQLEGTAVVVNNKVNHLNESFFIDVQHGRTDDKKYIFLELSGLKGIQEGFNEVHIDYPGSLHSIDRGFFFIDNLEWKFDKEVYVYAERGSVFINKRCCDGKIYGENGTTNLDFLMDDVMAEYLVYPIQFDGYVALLNIEIPALLYSWNSEEWYFTKPEDLWYADMADVVYIKCLGEELSLYVSGHYNEESKQLFKKTKAGLFVCDLTRLKTYFTKEKVIESINVMNDYVNETFLNIITRSVLAKTTVQPYPHSNKVVFEFDIIGKNKYYADLFKEEELILGKIPIEEGALTVDIPFETTYYSVDVYESEDEFGFDDDYIKVGSEYFDLINPQDLYNMSLKVKYIERSDATHLSFMKDYNYYVLVKEYLDENRFDGILAGRFVKDGKIMYAAEVVVIMNDSNSLSNIGIYKKTKDSFEPLLFDKKIKGVTDRNRVGSKFDTSRYFPLKPEQYHWIGDIIVKPRNLREGAEEWIKKDEESIKKDWTKGGSIFKQ